MRLPDLKKDKERVARQRRNRIRTYKNRKKRGECVRCGKKRDQLSAVSFLVTCKECRDYTNKNHRRRYWNMVRHGMCVICQVVLPTSYQYRTCEACLSDMRLAGKESRGAKDQK